MALSIEFVTRTDGYNASSAHPEESTNRALMTFVIPMRKCTADAKTMYAKSSTYGAKFDSLCKVLQENVLDSRYTRMACVKLKIIQNPHKQLKIKHKMDYSSEAAAGGPDGSMAHQLHSLWTGFMRSQVAS
jgi:hypothetical protein